MMKGKFGRKANKSYEDVHYTCTIRFLDDSEPITVTYQKDTKGQWLLDYVCKELNLVEKDYFGLRFVDSEKQRHWLDPTKTVYRQLKHVNPMVLCFRVKFYPAEPSKLKEEITRYFLFLQLRRDLHHGRLLCSPADANLLAAYIIQSEVGDYDPQDHPPGYVSQFKMLPKQTQKQEEKIAEIHKTLSGDVPSDAESAFLVKSSTLDTYGVDPHPVKIPKDNNSDQKGNQMYLGVTHLGIVTFQGNKRTHLFKWPQISKIAFEGKMFVVHVTVSEGEESSLYFKRKKHACGFKCPTFSACKHLWKCAVQQQYFFTLANSTQAPKVTSGGGWFTRGSKFRFSGRCQSEVYQDSATITRDPPNFVRSASNPQFVRNYNMLRSQTLPAKFREKKTNEPAEKNHISACDLDLLKKEQEEVVEESIPEELAVVVSDQPYAPMTPDTEEAPINIPVVEESPDGSPADLDTQIQELQTELERCKAANVEGNHVQAEPVVEAKVAPTPVESKPAAKGRSVLGCMCRMLLLMTAFVIIASIILTVLVLESDLEAPVLSDIRQLPEVADFRKDHYDPFKATMKEKLGMNA